jgi:hypothetical protein
MRTMRILHCNGHRQGSVFFENTSCANSWQRLSYLPDLQIVVHETICAGAVRRSAHAAVL